MLSKKIESVLNGQVQKEAYSANLYLAMASWSESHGFAGIAQWLYAQAEEERVHMLKFVRYINDRGGSAVIPAIEKPELKVTSIIALFEAVLKHEEYISGAINNIVGATLEDKDYTTQNWLQWFVNEQIEEEAQVRHLLDKLRLVGDNNMYIFDRDITSLRGKTSPALAT